MRATSALAKALGVTRVARVTGLDRVGVEVAAALRPSGHVLQVTQGKGLDFEQAALSALGEAAELAAAERVPAGLVLACAEELPSVALGVAPGLRVAWARAERLDGRGETWVPADAVWCLPFGAAWLGPQVSAWTTNGLAAHRTAAAAVEHACLEVLERDALARVLPGGWTAAAARARLLPGDGELAERLRGRGFDVFVFDLTPRGLRCPVIGALLFELEGGPIPLTAGYACRRTAEEAVEAALLEAAQSRLTEVHGAREDVAVGERAGGEVLRQALAVSRPRRRLRELPRWRGSLDAAAPAPLAVVRLAEAPLHVVKVVGEGLRRTELL